MTERNDPGGRYHEWLEEQRPGEIPPDVLPRVFAEIRSNPSRARPPWTLNRGWIGMSSLAVVAGALVVTVVMLGLPHGARPMAEATGSADATPAGWGSGSQAASASASFAGPSETAFPDETGAVSPTALATPTTAPTPTATQTPRPVVPGTITVRLEVDTVPADTAYFAVNMMNWHDYRDPEGMTPDLDQWSTWYFCGSGVHPVWPYGRQGTDPSPCVKGVTYEQRFTGMEPTYPVWFAFERVTTSGRVEPMTVLSHIADGSLLAFGYPGDVHRVPAPGTPPAAPTNCMPHGDDWGPSALKVGGVTNDGSFTWDAVTSAPLCVNLMEITPLVGAPAVGSMTLSVDGKPVWTLDFADYLNIGQEGAGSGERVIPVDTPIPIAAGQRLTLAFTGWPECWGNIGLNVHGYPPGV